ncbi:8-oxo-dGTP diphosphatase MutT [Pseudobacillus badius]|uniref:8-oxo-dGTP diphosphatase MutT n=1 Tax=Bacillus badius TaxID=1455 RepID=UPI0007B0BA57|nr:8-oxo-dGTP diphosphatase MutT [Bacillus badius]KZN99440.1 DNA mismatch repair protein MutT [Bacillus badius]OCS85278.1 DNA mismatch repair protein MutT [Bacillus badius]OVE50328.1 DNA mismatch repair protein MutT [Bacillus badius]TDW01219.1 8-oxo-dGTP diphosphatase [Bacillus badius]
MKKIIKVVAAVCFNEQNEVLCALRSPDMSLPNLWEFAGGKVEKEETPEESLIREIQEELGCTVKVHELIEDVVHEYPNIIVNLLTYRTTITAGTPRAKEHAEIKWVSLHDLPSLEWAPADIPTINKLLSTRVDA